MRRFQYTIGCIHVAPGCSLPIACASLQVLGCDMRTSYPATLFRFPLRTAEQAAASRISKQVCSQDAHICSSQRRIVRIGRNYKASRRKLPSSYCRDDTPRVAVSGLYHAVPKSFIEVEQQVKQLTTDL